MELQQNIDETIFELSSNNPDSKIQGVVKYTNKREIWIIKLTDTEVDQTISLTRNEAAELIGILTGELLK